MKKKIIATLLVAAMAMSVLAGCGKKNADSDPDSVTEELTDDETAYEDNIDDTFQSDEQFDETEEYAAEADPVYDPTYISDELKNKYLDFINGKIEGVSEDGKPYSFPQDALEDEQKLQYSFYDLNNDGNAELLTQSYGFAFALYTVNEEGTVLFPTQEFSPACTEIFITKYKDIVFWDASHAGREVMIASMLNSENILVAYDVLNHEFPDPNYSEDIEESFTEAANLEDEPAPIDAGTYEYLTQSFIDSKIELEWITME